MEWISVKDFEALLDFIFIINVIAGWMLFLILRLLNSIRS